MKTSYPITKIHSWNVNFVIRAKPRPRTWYKPGWPALPGTKKQHNHLQSIALRRFSRKTSVLSDMNVSGRLSGFSLLSVARKAEKKTKLPALICHYEVSV